MERTGEEGSGKEEMRKEEGKCEKANSAVIYAKKATCIEHKKSSDHNLSSLARSKFHVFLGQFFFYPSGSVYTYSVIYFYVRNVAHKEDVIF